VILKAATSVDGFIAEAPDKPTALTSAEANRHAHRLRASVDAIGVGVGTVIADDPLLTPRGIYRERPLVRVIFDRSLRTPPSSRLFSTAAVGPVMIVTSERASRCADLRRPLEGRGAQILIADGSGLREAFRLLGDREIASLLLEGGAAIHAAAWDDDLVDFVRLYVAPRALGGGVPLLPGRSFSSSALVDRRVEQLGPDVLIEGYVHGPR
jgi:diaminohydroxyphosphoribosylaminopyrimidine deaminase / 5-amino-6-(5-phosphoribosylamino)uracil reductase